MKNILLFELIPNGCYPFWEKCMPLLYVLLLILVFLVFFNRRGKGLLKFVKYVLSPCTLVGGLFVYFIGYDQVSPGHWISNVFQAIFSTVRLFVLGNDLVEIHAEVINNHSYMLWFSIITASAAVIFASFFLNLFGKRLIYTLKIWWNHSNKNYIFFGVNEASISLAKDILKKKNSRIVIFIKDIDINENSLLYRQAEELGALLISNVSIIEKIFVKNEESIIRPHEAESSPKKILVENNYLKKFKLIKRVSSRESYFFFLTENEDFNVRASRSLLAEIKQTPINKQITFHIRTLSEDMEDLYYESFSTIPSKIMISFLNDSDIAARQLIRTNNPVDWINIDYEYGIAKSNFHVLIIGFGQSGIAVLKNLIEFGQFVGSNFRSIVIDKNVNSISGSFVNRYPGLGTNYYIDYVETTVGNSKFYETIKKELDELDYITIALGNDALNIQTAFDIQQMVLKISDRPLKILVRLNDNYSYDNLFNQIGNLYVETFGREKDVFTEDIVIRGSMEKSAKKIHDYYNAKTLSGKKMEWDKLSRIKQLSNISVAEHIHTKLALAGLTVQGVKAFQSKDDFTTYIGKIRLENLAIGEHLRWNTNLFVNGWNTLKLEELPTGSNYNKIENKRLHACLVDWETLSLVNKHFKEDFYDYDRENILGIYDLIKEGIYTE